MTDRELMQMALDALILNNKEWKELADSGDAGWWKAEDQDYYHHTELTIKALRDRLAQPDPEPVAWFVQYEYRHEFLWKEPTSYEKNSALEIKPLYTAPVHAIDISQERVDETTKRKHEWVGLTDDEITMRWSWSQSREAEETATTQQHAFAYAIEAKLKEKNT